MNDSKDSKSKYYKYTWDRYIQYYHKVNNILSEEGNSSIGLEGLCIIIHLQCDGAVSIDNSIRWIQKTDPYTEISEEEFNKVYYETIKKLSL